MATLPSGTGVSFTKEDLDRSAKQIRDNKAQYEQAIQNMTNTVNYLQGVWKGDGQASFYNSFHSLNSTFKNFSEMLESFAKFAEDYARDMTDLDARYGKAIDNK